MKKLLILVAVIIAGACIAQPTFAASYTVWASVGSGSCGSCYYSPYTTNYSYSYYRPYSYYYGSNFNGSRIAYDQFFSGPSNTYKPSKLNLTTVRVPGSASNQPPVVVSSGNGNSTGVSATGPGYSPMPAGECRPGTVLSVGSHVCVAQ
jgi:hypothetical protein